MATTTTGNSDPVTPTTPAEVDTANGMNTPDVDNTPAVNVDDTDTTDAPTGRTYTPLSDVEGDTTTASPHTLPSALTTPHALNGPNAQPASVAEVPADKENHVKAIVKDLEGKTEGELRNLYADALVEESNAKRDLYILRQRLATLATDSEEEEETLLASAKGRLATALAYLRGTQIALGARPTTPTTN